MSAEHWVAAAAAGVLGAGAVLAARHSNRRSGTLIAPLPVFLAVWAVALGLFALPLIRYAETSPRAWLIIYGSIACFVAGCLLAERAPFAKLAGPGSNEPSRAPERLSAARLRLAWLVAAMLGLVGFAAFVTAIDAVAGLRALVSDFAYVRSLQGDDHPLGDEFQSTYGLWKLLTYFNPIAFLVWTIALRTGAFRGRWRVAVALGPVSLLPYVFTGERTLLLTTLVWIALFHLVWRPVANPKRLLAIAGAVFVVALGAFLAIGERLGRTVENNPEIAAALTNRQFDPLVQPYLYATGNLPTFSRLLDDPIRPETYGQMTVLPVTKVASLVGLTGTPPEEIGAYYAVPFKGFNTYTWLSAFYLDFGVAGCLVLPLLAGLLFTVVTRRALARRTLLLSWVASLGLFVVAFSPMVNRITSTLTWQNLLVGFVLVAIVKPGALSLRRRSTFAGRRAALGAAAVAATGVLLLAIVAVTRPALGESAASPYDMPRALADASARAGRVFSAGDSYPLSYMLASQLRVSDPSVPVRPLPTTCAGPGEPGVIGVVTTPTSLQLRGRDARGLHELRREEIGGRTRIVGPRMIPPPRPDCRPAVASAPLPARAEPAKETIPRAR